jgi:hypothetical protein
MQAGNSPEERALAAAGRAEDANELAVADFEAEILQGVNGAGAGLVVLGGMVDRQFHRPSRSFGVSPVGTEGGRVALGAGDRMIWVNHARSYSESM